MAKFYGTLEGNRGVATRCGSDSSGIKASAQSYDGSVIVSLRYNNNGDLRVNVGTADGSRPYTDWNSSDFYGTFEEFKALLKLNEDIKTGKVKIVRKRAKKGEK